MKPNLIFTIQCSLGVQSFQDKHGVPSHFPSQGVPLRSKCWSGPIQGKVGVSLSRSPTDFHDIKERSFTWRICQRWERIRRVCQYLSRFYTKKNNDLILEPLKCCNIGFLLEVRPHICGHHIRSICCTKFSASSSTFPPRKYVWSMYIDRKHFEILSTFIFPHNRIEQV